MKIIIFCFKHRKKIIQLLQYSFADIKHHYQLTEAEQKILSSKDFEEIKSLPKL